MKKRAVKKPGFQKRVLDTLDKHSALLTKQGEILAEHSEILGMIVKKMATHDDLAQTRMELGGKIDNVSNRLDYELDKRTSLEFRVDKLEKKVFK